MVNLQYDPNRSANIALIEYEDGERRYILAPNGLKAGHIIMTGLQAVGGQDIAALAVLILDQGDVGGAVGVILQVHHSAFPSLSRLKSMMRYFCLLPPPRWRTVMRP